MDRFERRTVEELLARYTLEPSLRDIYVEGSSDRVIVEWYLSASDLGDAAVYNIDTVEIPRELLDGLGLENGNRGRIIALAKELESHLAGPAPQVTCLADRDFDTVLGINLEAEPLLLTDYTCMEMYCFDPRVLQKYLTVGLRGFPDPASDVLERLSLILEDLFLIRLASRILGINEALPDFTRCCSLVGANIRFDREEYARRLTNKARRSSDLRRLLETAESYRGVGPGDPRHRVHGHDYITLLRWYLGNRRVAPKLLDQDVMERTLATCTEVSDMSRCDMFAKLKQRVQREAAD